MTTPSETHVADHSTSDRTDTQASRIVSRILDSLDRSDRFFTNVESIFSGATCQRSALIRGSLRDESEQIEQVASDLEGVGPVRAGHW